MLEPKSGLLGSRHWAVLARVVHVGLNITMTARNGRAIDGGCR